MKFGQYFSINVIFFLLAVVFSWVFLKFLFHRPWDFGSSVAGLVLALGNSLLGFALIRWGMNKSQQLFFMILVGGMIFRFLLLFSLLFVLIIAVHLALLPLIISLLIAYVIFLIIEIWFVNKNTGMVAGE